MSEVNWLGLKKQGEDATKPLEVGRYRFKVERPVYKVASTGAPMIMAHMVVQGGPKHGKDLIHNFVLSVDSAFALSRWFANFEALGIDESFWQQLSESGYTQEQSLSVVAQAIDGRLFDADVEQREFRGTQRNEFKSFYPVSGQPSVSVSAVASSGGGSSSPSVNPGVPSGLSSPPLALSPSTPSVPRVTSVPTPHVSPVTSPSIPAPSAPPEEPF